MDSPILSNVDVFPWSVPVSFLANEHFSSTHNLPTEALYATAFRIGISAVTGGATGFLVLKYHIHELTLQYRIQAAGGLIHNQ